jgi:hypothetical protein
MAIWRRIDSRIARLQAAWRVNGMALVVFCCLLAGAATVTLKADESATSEPNPLRPRAFGGKGAEGLKKEITSSRTPSDPGPSAGREPRG